MCAIICHNDVIIRDFNAHITHVTPAKVDSKSAIHNDSQNIYVTKKHENTRAHQKYFKRTCQNRTYAAFAVGDPFGLHPASKNTCVVPCFFLTHVWLRGIFFLTF